MKLEKNTPQWHGLLYQTLELRDLIWRTYEQIAACNAVEADKLLRQAGDEQYRLMSALVSYLPERNPMYATCSACQQPMNVDSCTLGKLIFPNGDEYPRIPFPQQEPLRCHGCNIAPGGFHHEECDVEECPRCHGQLISCGCLDEGILNDVG